MKRIMGFFLALVMFIGCLPLNTIETYANGDVAIDEAHFPDKIFRDYVKANFDTDKDEKLSQDELDKVVEIDISGNSVFSLKGIEHFKNLTYLNCSDNYLKSLDVSNNPNLTKLYCSGNNLTSLVVGENPNLTKLECYLNKLSSLDVSNNPNLTKLDCNNNNLKSLDVSNNPNLTKLDCSFNHELKSLDVRKNTNLNELSCVGNKLTSLDLSKNTELNQLYCNSNKLTKLDLSNNTKLAVLNCNENELTSLVLGENPKLYQLYCFSNNLTSLDLSKNPKLYQLYCYDNKLTKLDLSKNTSIYDLRCENNKLTSLVLGENTKLTYLDCSVNHLTELDVSKNTKLSKLNCSNNNLMSLDVSKNTNLWNLYCSTNKLTSLVLGDPYELDCSNNNLTSLDVKENAKLTTLYCDNQQYNITVFKGIREFKYSKFPGQFKKEKVTSPVGAKFGDDALTVDSDNTNKVNYKYKVGDNKEMEVYLNVTYIGFDPEHVVSMKVKTQPKLIYTEGEKLDLSGLVVTLTDKQGLTKNVAFKDFEANGIKAKPANDTALTSEYNGKKVSLTKENSTEETEALTKDVAFRDFASNVIATNLIDDTALTLANNGKALKSTKENPITAETEALTVNKPVVGPVDPTDPNAEKPADTSKYWTVTFKSEDETKGVVDAKNTVYVLKNSGKTLADLTKYAPKVTAKAGYEFDKWEPALDKNTVIDKDLTVKAYFKKVGSPTPQDPTDPPAPPQECWIVTFKSEDETKGTVDAKNRVAVLKNSGKTLADLAKYAPKVTAKAGYEFDKWEPALDKNTVIDKDMTVKAHFKKAGTPTPQDPPDPPAPPQEYWTVTFESEDETKGTVDANNKVRVLKNSGKTLADLANDAPKVTAKAGFKFTGWEPALDKNTSINRNLTVNAKFEKVTPTPQDPPVVGPVDPTPQDPPVVGPVDPTPNDPPVVGPVDPTQPGGKPKVANNGKLPKTANSMNIELYTFLMILSAGLLVVAFKRKKRVNR